MTTLRCGLAGLMLLPTLAWAADGEPRCAPEVDLVPYLTEIQAQVPPEGVDDAVLGLLARFPHDPSLQGRGVDILLGRRETGRARLLVEETLARFPDCPDSYLNALDFYGKVNDKSRQEELAEAWQARLPGDAGALFWWLDLGKRDAQEAGKRIDRLLSAVEAGSSHLDLCIRLLSETVYRQPATRCLTRIAGETRDESLRTLAGAFLVSAGGRSRSAGEGSPRPARETPARGRAHRRPRLGRRAVSPQDEPSESPPLGRRGRARRVFEARRAPGVRGSLRRAARPSVIIL